MLIPCPASLGYASFDDAVIDLCDNVDAVAEIVSVLYAPDPVISDVRFRPLYPDATAVAVSLRVSDHGLVGLNFQFFSGAPLPTQVLARFISAYGHEPETLNEFYIAVCASKPATQRTVEFLENRGINIIVPGRG